MAIARRRATVEGGEARLSARGALAAAPASIPDAAVRILPVITVDPRSLYLGLHAVLMRIPEDRHDINNLTIVANSVASLQSVFLFFKDRFICLHQTTV